MDISLILKTVGVGLIVTVATQILTRAGRDDQAMLVSVVGVVVVLLMLTSEINNLFDTIKNTFGL